MHKPIDSEAEPPGSDIDELRELHLNEIPFLYASFWPHAKESTLADTLPYARLSGEAFERLCFHLLLADGLNVRFWGKRGQAQYGIDIILSDGEVAVVYQCKNVIGYDSNNLARDLEHFRREWLTKRPALPRPQRFVLCCSARIVEQDAWEKEKKDFWEDTGVHVEEWHRDILDERLREHPDIIADLFGDAVAELYCGRKAWNLGLFRPLLPGAGDKHIERYLQLRAAGSIVRDDRIAARFHEIMNQFGVVLIEGLSGSGKTITSLDLAQFLDQGAWRVFFVDLRHDATADIIFRGIKDRATRPTVFILDDCHWDYEKVDDVVARTSIALRTAKIRVILTSRTAPPETEFLEQGRPELIDELRHNGQIITLNPTVAQYSKIISQAGLDLSELTTESVERLFALTARDLFLFHIIIEILEEKVAGLKFSFEDLYPLVLRRYFGSEKPYVPYLKQLAAVAQFDIPVPCSLFPFPLVLERYQEAIERLVPISNRPPSWSFVHASAAELIFRALAWADADIDASDTAAQSCKSVLMKQHPQISLGRDLPSLLRMKLPVGDDVPIKQKLLIDPTFVNFVAENIHATPLSALSLASFLTANLSTPTQYTEWLISRVDEVVEGIESPSESLASVFLAFRTLQLVDPARHTKVVEQNGPALLHCLLERRGTLFELLRLLTTDVFGPPENLINELDESKVERLIENTVVSGRSIGTLSFRLRKVTQFEAQSGTGLGRLAALERRLEPIRFLLLIEARGTVFDLLKVLEECTPAYAAKLIAALTESTINALVEKTVSAGRSLGTLNLSLRELSQREFPGESHQSQLEAFEERFGYVAMLRLLDAQGTVGDLFKILEKSTSGYAAALIDRFDPSIAAKLVDRTIAEESSIGTINFSLRELAQRVMPGKAKVTQLEALQAGFAASTMLRLLKARGTVIELLQLVAASTSDYAEALVSGFSKKDFSKLIDKTIADKRRLGAFHFALRKLRFGRPRLHERLETMLGMEEFWRLVVGVGDLNILSQLTDSFSAGFWNDALSAERAPDVAGWTMLVQRDDVYGVARFLKSTLDPLDQAVRMRIHDAILENAAAVVGRSSWSDLANGLNVLSDSHDTPSRRVLHDLAHRRVLETSLIDLAFVEFTEACAGLSCLWSIREEARTKIAQEIWTLLPAESVWPVDRDFFRAARRVLILARSPIFGDADATRVLHAFASFSAGTKIEQTEPLLLFLFSWNLFALWYDRCRAEGDFGGVQTTQLRSRLVQVVEEHAPRRGRNIDKLNRLALAGILAFQFPDLRNRLQNAVRGKVSGARWLIEEADENLSFIPAFFAYHGLALIQSEQQVFSPGRCWQLLGKVRQYDEQGPAIGFICDWLKKKIVGRR